MKVILKEDVETLGKRGDTIKVTDGYARNYLIPKGLALEATSISARAIEHEKKLIAKRAEKEKKNAEAMLAAFSGVAVTIARKTADQEKLFGSVTTKDIERPWRRRVSRCSASRSPSRSRSSSSGSTP